MFFWSRYHLIGQEFRHSFLLLWMVEQLAAAPADGENPRGNNDKGEFHNRKSSEFRTNGRKYHQRMIHHISQSHDSTHSGLKRRSLPLHHSVQTGKTSGQTQLQQRLPATSKAPKDQRAVTSETPEPPPSPLGRSGFHLFFAGVRSAFGRDQLAGMDPQHHALS